MDQTQNGNNYYPHYPQYPNYMSPIYIPNQPVVIPQVYNSYTYHLEREIKYLRDSIDDMKKELNELKNNAVSNSFIDNTVEKFKLQDEINNETVTNLKNVHKRINVVFKKINKN